MKATELKKIADHIERAESEEVFINRLKLALKKHAIEFAKHTWNPLGGLNKAEDIYTEWFKQQ